MPKCITKSIKVDLKNKEMGPIPGKTGFTRVVFSRSPLSCLNSHLERGGSPILLILPWLLRPMREGAQGGAPSTIQAGTGGLRR